MGRESITINKNTNITHLQEFANRLGDTSRLRAKPVEGGFELYAKDSKPSLWSRITGRSEQTRSNAKEAVRMVLNNTERNLGGPVLDNVRGALATGISSKDIKGDTLKALADAAGGNVTVNIRTEDNPELVAVLQNRGPGLAKLGDTGKALIGDIASRLEEMPFYERDDAEGLAGQVEISLRNVLTAMPSSQNSLADRLALSSGSALKYDLRSALGKQFPQLSGEGGRQILDKAFDKMSVDLIRTKETNDNKLPISGGPFERGAKLGSGSYGEVAIYTNPNTNKSVAVKTFKAPTFDPSAYKTPDDAKAAKVVFDKKTAAMAADFKREAAVHRSLSANGRENVVRFEGTVKMANGAIGIVMECMSGKNATDLSLAIDNALTKNWITPAEAQKIGITCAKDIAVGLGAMNEGKAFFHGDSDLRNYFISDSGQVKLGDFGLTDKTERYDIMNMKVPESGEQIGPELMNALIKKRFAEGKNHQVSLESRFKGLSDDDRNTLQSDATKVGEFNGTRALDASKVDLKAAETWSFGQAAFNIIMNRPLMSKFSSAQEARVTDYGYNQNSAIDPGRRDDSRTVNEWRNDKTGHLAGDTGNAALNTFFNSVLHADPNQRMKPENIADDPALRMPPAESKKYHAMLAAVLKAADTNDANHINTARNAVYT